MRDPTDATRAGASPDRRLSRRERIGLFVGRGMDKRLNPLGRWLYRRTKGGITRPWKVDALLLTTRGRRSGRERTVVLQFFRDGDAMIVAAANDGGTSHPGWYFNLAADPAARVEVMGRAIAVRAEELSPAGSRSSVSSRSKRPADRTGGLRRGSPVNPVAGPFTVQSQSVTNR